MLASEFSAYIFTYNLLAGEGRRLVLYWGEVVRIFETGLG
jgi:hypothetical protein